LGIAIDVQYGPSLHSKSPEKNAQNSAPHSPTEKKRLTFVDADQKYSFLLLHCENYDKIDFMWRCSKEKLFMKNLIEARQQGALTCLLFVVYVVCMI
jgi:hypothetical protein